MESLTTTATSPIYTLIRLTNHSLQYYYGYIGYLLNFDSCKGDTGEFSDVND